jgi:adenylate cyclase
MPELLRKFLKFSPFKAGCAVAIAAALLYWALGQFPALGHIRRSIDHRCTDVMFRVRGARPTTGQVVIVDIDEKSLAEEELGQWPWSRDKFAKILRTIHAAGPKAIGLDMVFAEADRTSLKNYLGPLSARLGRAIPADPEKDDNDKILGEAISDTGTVAGYFFVKEDDGRPLSEYVTTARLTPLDEDTMPSLEDLYTPRLALLAVTEEERQEEAEAERQAAGTAETEGEVKEPKRKRPVQDRDEDTCLMEAHRAVLNTPAIDDCVMSAGFFNAEPDDSGMVRKVPLLYSCLLRGEPEKEGGPPVFNPTVGAGLSLAMLMVGEKAEKVQYLASYEQGLYALKIRGRESYVDGQANVYVNYRGKAGPGPASTFPYISAVDVYRGKVPKAALSGKYVLIGTSATGLKDLRATPFTNAGPGVEVHANIIDNFLACDALRYDRNLDIMVTLLLVLVGGVALSAMLAYAGPLWGGMAGIAFMMLSTVGNYRYFFLNGEIIGVTWPLLTVLAVFIGVTLANYFTEGRQKRFLHGAFSKMVAPQIVAELVKNPGKLSLTGEEKVMTVMFADIRNFTGISEKMAPQEICQLLNDFLTEMTEIIKSGRGSVDKYLGDEIMAFWGAPSDDPAHAEHSVRVALGMRAQVRVLAEAWSQKGLPLFDMGVGLNSGKVRVGNMGSRDQFNYTVIGDNVNLASRLQGLNKAYGTGIIISQATLDMLPEEFLVRPVDLVQVVGREQPVAIYEPLAVDRSDEKLVASAEGFARALRRYRQRRFAEAGEIIAELEAAESQKLYQVYLERIEELAEDPPGEDWDGVYVFRTK